MVVVVAALVFVVQPLNTVTAMYVVISVIQFDTGSGNHVYCINIKIIIPGVMVKVVQPMVVARKEKL